MGIDPALFPVSSLISGLEQLATFFQPNSPFVFRFACVTKNVASVRVCLPALCPSSCLQDWAAEDPTFLLLLILGLQFVSDMSGKLRVPWPPRVESDGIIYCHL